MEERTYNTYKSAREVLVGSLLGGTDLNYVAHKFFVRRPSADGLKQREFLEMTAMTRRKDLADGVGLNRLRRATYNGARRTAIPHCLNGTELSREEFQYNLLLRYGIVPFKLPTDCDGCEKKFLLPHAISCPKGVLVLEQYTDAAKEWGALSSRAINPLCIYYEPKINSRTVQGERNGSGVRVAMGEQE